MLRTSQGAGRFAVRLQVEGRPPPVPQHRQQRVPQRAHANYGRQVCVWLQSARPARLPPLPRVVCIRPCGGHVVGGCSQAGHAAATQQA